MASWNFNAAAIQGLVDHPKVQRDLDARADRAVAAGVAACPKDTGRLASTVGKETRGSGRRVSYGNDTDADYAPHVEWGTRAHDITPNSKQALYWPGAAHPVKRVHHPGTPAHHVMGGAALDAARRSA